MSANTKPDLDQLRQMVRALDAAQHHRLQALHRFAAFLTPPGERKKPNKVAIAEAVEHAGFSLGRRYPVPATSAALSPAHRVLAMMYAQAWAVEKSIGLEVEAFAKELPIYGVFFEPIQGLGPRTAARVLTSFDMARTPSPSSLWAYASLDVVNTGEAKGEGRSRWKKAHFVTQPFEQADGRIVEHTIPAGRAVLKKAAIGMADTVITKKDPHYTAKAVAYRERLQERDLVPAHRERMVRRYLAKMLLQDLWKALQRLDSPPASADTEPAA